MNIIDRVKAPTPNFFKKLRNIGIAIAAAAGTILAAPVAMPLIILKIASYLAVAGAVLGGVSQTAVKKEDDGPPKL